MSNGMMERDAYQGLDFWGKVMQQLTELHKATTADEVMSVVSKERNPYGYGGVAGEGFFAGAGGDMLDTLTESAGWSVVRFRADYYWSAQATNGDLITYVEGDVYRGNTMPRDSEIDV